jgi:hypothetical protein
MWVAIHKCMEAMIGICLYSYLYFKLVKTMSLLLSPMLSLQENQRIRVRSRFYLEVGRG